MIWIVKLTNQNDRRQFKESIYVGMWGKIHNPAWVQELFLNFEEIDMFCIYRNNLNSMEDKRLLKFEEKWVTPRFIVAFGMTLVAQQLMPTLAVNAQWLMMVLLAYANF